MDNFLEKAMSVEACSVCLCQICALKLLIMFAMIMSLIFGIHDFVILTFWLHDAASQCEFNYEIHYCQGLQVPSVCAS